MPEFAKETAVSPERSRAEIEATLRRYKADRFFYGWEGGQAVIGFSLHGHMIRLAVPLPDPKARQFTHVQRRGTWFVRTDKQREDAYEQAVKQRWRALLLLVKANLEAIDLGLLSVEQAFLGQIMLKGGQTVAQVVVPQLADAGGAIRLLPGS